MQNVGSYKVFLVSLILVAILGVPLVNSSFANNVTITSSGTIVTILPLHVDGRYIKDSSGNIVVLRGVNVGGFTDLPGGKWWNGIELLTYADWQSHQALVTAELDAIKSWGCNVVRVHIAAQYWVKNTNSFRTIMYEFAQLCAQRNLYVIIDGYRIWGWYDGSGNQQAVGQDALPYPPYQIYANSSTIIANKYEYENMMVSIATTLSSCSNVIISMWNEAGGGIDLTAHPTAESDWFNVTQTTINWIRGNGSDAIVLATWDYGLWANLNYPPPTPPNEGGNPAGTLSWIYDYPLNGTNIAYDTHIYSAFGWGSAITYAQAIQGLTYCWVPYVLNTMNKPLFIGECGAPSSYGYYVEFANILAALNYWDVGYTGFFFANTGYYVLLNSYGPSWTPSDAGQILRSAIAGITPPATYQLKVSSNLDSSISILFSENGTSSLINLTSTAYSTPSTNTLFSGNYTVTMPSTTYVYTHHVLFGGTQISSGIGYSAIMEASGPYTITSPATVSQISFYSVAAGHAKVAIYNSTTIGGEVHSGYLIVASSAQSCPANTWNTFNITTTTLPAGTYFLAIKIDTDGMIAGVNHSYMGEGIFSDYADPFPSPSGASLGYGGSEKAIYIPTAPFTTATYNFVQWNDSNTSPTRTINLTTNMALTATYQLTP